MTTEEFDMYLVSIGGLENGYFTDRPPITNRYFFKVNDGWLGLVKDCIDECIAAGWNKQICQVKEKFGGMRFYVNEASNEVFSIIEKYEAKSESICEYCGGPATKKTINRWIHAICDNHFKEKTQN